MGHFSKDNRYFSDEALASLRQAAKRVHTRLDWKAKLLAGKARFKADSKKVAAKAKKCSAASQRRWSKLTKEERKNANPAFIAMNAARAAKKAARIALAPKECKCGCGRAPKPGNSWISGHNAGITPRHYSEETLAKFRENAISSRNKAIASGHHLGQKKGFKHSEEAKQKSRAGVIRAIAEGRFDPGANGLKGWARSSPERAKNLGHGTHGIFPSEKMNRQFRYDSSWELERLQVFEKDPNVVFYLRTPFRIPYAAPDGKQHSYFVDFSLFEAKGSKIVLEEIKPTALFPYNNNEFKLAALRAHCDKQGYVCRVLSTLEACKEIT